MYELLFIVVGAFVYVYAARWWKQRKLSQAAQWPAVQGYITEIEESYDKQGIGSVLIHYRPDKPKISQIARQISGTGQEILQLL